MLPLTETLPKAMIPVNGEPFIAHLLRMLASRGVGRCVLCTSHLGEAIEAFVGDGSTYGIDVAYSDDGPVRCGTAGALKRALPALGERFLMTYGDAYLPVDYAAIASRFLESEKHALMTVWHNRDRLAPSNVAMCDGEIVAYNKAPAGGGFEYIDYGVGAFQRTLFDEIPAGEPVDLADVVRPAIGARSLAAFEVYERFYEIGSPAGLRDLEQYLREHRES